MKRLLQFAGTLGCLVSVTGAQEPRTGEQSRTRELPRYGEPTVLLADELIGLKVVNEQGENLGKIEDLVVQPDGDVNYAVLSFGGWLGMGDKLFAMPWSVLRSVEPDAAKRDSSRSLILPVDKERLKYAPGFDKKNWPSMANPDWSKDIDTFYLSDRNPHVNRPVEAGVRTSYITWRASELEGTNIETPSGDKLGDIKDVAIDTNGNVKYVVVSVGGFLGLGDRLVAVPWDCLTQSRGGDDGDKKKLSLASTKDMLKDAPEFKNDKENRAEMGSAAWIQRIHDHFSCPSSKSSSDSSHGQKPDKTKGDGSKGD